MYNSSTDKDSVRMENISYIGNRETNKYKSNVRIYVQPFFNSTDELTVIDMKHKIKRSRVTVTDIHCGKYVYQRISDSMFGKHVNDKCMMIPTANRSTIKKDTKLDKYLLYSNTDKKKTPIVMIIMNRAFYEYIRKG